MYVYQNESNVASVEPPSPDEVIADLTEQLYDLCREAETLRGEMQVHKDRADKILGWYRNDMQHWEITLRAAKEKHGWCDEGTNEVIDTLNSGFIGGYEVERYTEEYEVEVEVSTTLCTTITVTVQATCQEEADDLVADSPEDYFSPSEELESVLQYGYPDIEVTVQ